MSAAPELPAAPAAGAAPGGRPLRFFRVPRFALEGGDVLHDVVLAYGLEGPPEAVADDLVLVFHALTGSADVAGEGTGWWREVVGPGRAVDTRRYAVLCANLLGSCYGTTGPASPAGGRADGRAGERAGFPPVTPRDQARLVGLLVDALGARSVALVAGGSLGGMVALEWVLLHPGRARSTVVLAAPAAHTAWAIGWNAVQRRALDLAAAAGSADAVAEGLALARMVGMLTYRSPEGLEARFARAQGGAGEWAVAGWLARHGVRLASRFDPASYRALLGAMDAHDVGAGRGGLDRALATLGVAGGYVVGVGIAGDALYPAAEVRRWTDAAGVRYAELRSEHGHDAFLLEAGQVGRILGEALDAADAARPGGPSRDGGSDWAAAPGAGGGAGRAGAAPALPPRRADDPADWAAVGACAAAAAPASPPAPARRSA